MISREIEADTSQWQTPHQANPENLRLVWDVIGQLDPLERAALLVSSIALDIVNFCDIKNVDRDERIHDVFDAIEMSVEDLTTDLSVCSKSKRKKYRNRRALSNRPRRC